MTAPKPKSSDFGAALAGLVLGGSTLFLVVLTIVWLTNSHFAGEKAEHGAASAAPAATTSPTPPPAPAH